MSNLSKNLLKRSKELNLPYAWVSDNNSILSMKYILASNSIFELELDDPNYKSSVSQFLAFYKAYRTIYHEDDKLFDFIPTSNLNNILDGFLSSIRPMVPREIPKNYKYLKDLDQLLINISKQKLNIVDDSVDEINSRNCFKNTIPYIDYNLFGTVTGRLTTSKNSFPILNLNKNCRNMIHPTNDYFIELDFNSCDIRSILALQGIPQPSEDIHQWNQENVFKGKFDRKKCKQKIFAWMYNPAAVDLDIELVYNKKLILDKYYIDGEVNNGYRKIKVDDYHALNYLVQSLSSDIFLQNTIKIDKILRNKKSKIAFMMHDSVIIDASKEDFNNPALMDKIVQVFKKTDFGNFRVNISTGKNYGSMEQTK